MRTREMKLEDYLVPKEDEEPLREHCTRASTEDRRLLFEMCISAANGLEIPVYDSLTTGKGYEYIDRRRPIPAMKADFYAYQRKTLALYYDMLRTLGKWPDIEADYKKRKKHNLVNNGRG